MTLDEFIESIEGMLEEDIQLLTPKERIAAWLNAKEFQKPKMQRTSINPNDSRLPDDIYND